MIDLVLFSISHGFYFVRSHIEEWRAYIGIKARRGHVSIQVCSKIRSTKTLRTQFDKEYPTKKQLHTSFLRSTKVAKNSGDSRELMQ